MFTSVILRATQGRLRGQEWVLPDGSHEVLGRAPNCSVRLLDSTLTASRRHCAIGVEAPAVWVRDLGSLNGTFVNGVKVGQRGWWEDWSQVLDEAPGEESPAFPLFEGDELQVGENTFVVELSAHVPDFEAEARDPEELWSCACGAGV
jgi:serine/threonine-protein kinase